MMESEQQRARFPRRRDWENGRNQTSRERPAGQVEQQDLRPTSCLSMPHGLHVVKRPGPDISPISTAWGIVAVAAMALDELRRMRPEQRDAFAVLLHSLVVERSEQLWRDAKVLAGLETVLRETEARWGGE